MPVRLRIILLFLLLVMITLGMVCGGIYYFSYTVRVSSIKTRLLNQAKTTARLLSKQEIFNQRVVQRIDSLTTLIMKNKIVEVYDDENQKIYSYSAVRGDTLYIGKDILNGARVKKAFFYQRHKEAVTNWCFCKTAVIMSVFLDPTTIT
jgi:two-component system sensor histidine kinase ArlS